MTTIRSGLVQWSIQQIKKRWVQLSWMVVLSLLLYMGVKLIGIDSIISQSENLQNISVQHKILVAAIIFIWSFFLFTTFAPLGTVTIIIGGYLLGIGVGFIQFGSLCLASIFLYVFFDTAEEIHVIENYTDNSVILALFKMIDHNNFMTVCALRIIPVIPSAACVFICQVLNVSLRRMLQATFLLGWVRPVFFAYLGSSATNILTLLKNVSV